ncbi:hypothetical protein LINGRAPRIM_LOCUS2891, partial [Linum grandiflorum]
CTSHLPFHGDFTKTHLAKPKKASLFIISSSKSLHFPIKNPGEALLHGVSPPPPPPPPLASATASQPFQLHRRHVIIISIPTAASSTTAVLLLLRLLVLNRHRPAEQVREPEEERLEHVRAVPEEPPAAAFLIPMQRGPRSARPKSTLWSALSTATLLLLLLALVLSDRPGALLMPLWAGFGLPSRRTAASPKPTRSGLGLSGSTSGRLETCSPRLEGLATRRRSASALLLSRSCRLILLLRRKLSLSLRRRSS